MNTLFGLLGHMMDLFMDLQIPVDINAWLGHKQETKS